ncbi:MAG: helix-turn-helix domain-containing protein [Actinomycetes bacterium]
MTRRRRPDTAHPSPATIAEALREEIAAAVAASGFSQRDLSEVSGVAQGRISQALTGRTDPRISTLVRLLAAAGYRLRVEKIDTGS